MAANLYHQIPYRTFPRRQTHPDRLAALATLFGITPAPVTQCRVLELGCGDGGNLIPLAYSLGGSRFTGIDLAARPIAQARRTVRALGLTNIALHAACLSTARGEFDYIIAHGIYSWVPAPLRDALLRVCRRHLAPHGVAFISYNANPGHHRRQALREMLLYHTRASPRPLKSAREFLNQYAPEEASLPDDLLFHDLLAPVNHPVYFHEFLEHAAAHSLQYLGDADPHEMFSPAGKLAGLEGEQYLDFARQRQFRQTLLCRAEVALRRVVTPSRLDRFYYSRNPHGRRIPGNCQTVEAVAQALDDTHPLPAAFDELIPYAGSRAALREILHAMLAAGCVDIHVHDFPCQESVSEMPRSSRLARYQAATSTQVTNLCHMPVELDEVARRLLLLLDGTRSQDAVARALSAIAGAPSHRSIRRHLPASLDWMARMALLEVG